MEWVERGRAIRSRKRACGHGPRERRSETASGFVPGENDRNSGVESRARGRRGSAAFAPAVVEERVRAGVEGETRKSRVGMDV